MAKKRYVVRVKMNYRDDPGGTNVGMLLEWLRYAGVITYHVRSRLMDVSGDGAKEPRYRVYEVFDIHTPQGSDSQVWADMNSRRIRSFGIDAQPIEAGSRYVEE